jgi:hypothetical protein
MTVRVGPFCHLQNYYTANSFAGGYRSQKEITRALLMFSNAPSQHAITIVVFESDSKQVVEENFHNIID